MTESQKKSSLKVIDKIKYNENKMLTQLPELPTQEPQQIKRKRRRARSQIINWDEVLDFDTLALNSQVYEASWMKSTKKRKKICKSSDKKDSNQIVEAGSYNLTKMNSQCESTSQPELDDNTLSISPSNILDIGQKKCSGGMKGNLSKQQKKSSEKENNLINAMKKKLQASQQNGQDDSFAEENLTKVDKQDESIIKIKQTRQKSQKERELKDQQGEDILQQKKLMKNNTQSNQQKIRSESDRSKINNSLQSSTNSVSKPINASNQINKFQESYSNTNKSSSIEQKSLNLLKSHHNKKIMNKTQNGQKNESSGEKNKKGPSNEEENKKDRCISENQQAQLQTRSQTKRSPTSYRLNEDALVINQSYDDSDASTRDEDHQENHIRQPHIKGRSSNNSAQRMKQNGSSSNNEKIGTKQSPLSKQNQKQEENDKYGRISEKTSIKNQNTQNGSIKLKNGKQQKQENEESQKEKKFCEKNKNKELSSNIPGEGEDNQIDKNKKQNNNKNNQKKNNKATNKNQFNLKLEETSNSNQISQYANSSKITFEQIDSQSQIQSLNLKNQPGQASLKGDSLAPLSASVENLNDQISKIPNKKSKFSQNIPQNQKTYSATSLESEQNLEKIDENLIIEESGFDNSNNNTPGLQQQQNNQQEIDLDQQQVPHLYIRNQDYATKVGRSYQALIPELGSYNYQQNHLERLVTQQKVWGKDWIEEKQQKIIVKCTATLKQWYGNRRNEEQCIQHLMLLGFDHTKYNEFLEENQDNFYNMYNQYDAKFIKKKIKKKSLFSCK